MRFFINFLMATGFLAGFGWAGHEAYVGIKKALFERMAEGFSSSEAFANKLTEVDVED